MNIAGYDAWKLAGPEDLLEPGTEYGETCNRFPEPDEDAPRNWRPKPCNGSMEQHDDCVMCDTCGQMA